MPNRIITRIRLFFRHNLGRLEALFFLLKSLLSERHFIYLSCILVGLSTSFAVIVLKSFAHNVFLGATYVNRYLKLPYINSILPIVGILLTVFVVKRVLDGRIEKGSSRILVAVAKKGGIMPRKQMYAQIITASLTVGLGGSAGLESPITITGAAFGSNFARKYKLSKNDRILLLACGVAAGIAAAFNAPIAGVLFSIEVILTDVTISAFIPIMISAATGALVSTIVLNEEVLLTFRRPLHFDWHNIPYYIVLGLLAGFVSLYHAKAFQKVEAHFAKLRIKGYRKALYGAIPLALIIFMFPTLFGEGYESIRILSNAHPEELLDNTILEEFKQNGWVLLLFAGITMLLKAYATGLTLASGGNGGNFAPSLFVGSYLGFFVAKFFTMLGFSKNLPIDNFTIVGMAGILSGLFHAPLTAIFLIGEITGGYNLMVPLMIVSSISFAVSKQFETYSMDVKHLADKGQVFTSNKDKNILSSLDIMEVVTSDLPTLSVNQKAEDVIALLSNTQYNHFAVTDDKNRLLGVVDFINIRQMIFSAFKVKYATMDELMTLPAEVASVEDSIEMIMEKFENTHVSYLPVLKDDRYYGFIYKEKVLEAYRQKLKDMVIE
ncbi:chloride channel protein [Flavobacterium subsaxonicum]|uniref:Transporter n=1 Tax=Flavobacterium subsaxonicum WB 4.1-42 = DSM 21790 TaxID=1121898 RepID=A0A0A2MM04_9FLAO|nr:chloride channel protein [Flavobacterium subsaxonicum]KGO92523.1 transporter [Flavobacterium subsaxonicum WB 4.1-42 = DSM 21790]